MAKKFSADNIWIAIVMISILLIANTVLSITHANVIKNLREEIDSLKQEVDLIPHCECSELELDLFFNDSNRTINNMFLYSDRIIDPEISYLYNETNGDIRAYMYIFKKLRNLNLKRTGGLKNEI